MPRALLIEDDRETADEIVAELVERGFVVEWAATGIEGLDKARLADADVMIVDRMLPGVDGLTIIEVIRKEHVRTPVLVLSALGAVDDRIRGLRAGGDDYLTKPFAIGELIARIEALLRSYLARCIGPEESFQAFTGRTGAEALRDAAEEISALRELASAHTAH